MRPVFFTQNASPWSVKLSEGPQCTGEQACAPSLSCLQAECPPEQQGALHTGTFGFSGDLIEVLEFFLLNSPSPLKVDVLIYFDKGLGLGDMSKFTQQEAMSLLIPLGFSLRCRGIRK